MGNNFTEDELASVRGFAEALEAGQIQQAVGSLRALKDTIQASIPARQCISRGITWVLQRISTLFVEIYPQDKDILAITMALCTVLDQTDILLGVPIFLMGEYGKRHPIQVFTFFESVADSGDWTVREFAQAGFRPIIEPNQAVALPWLKQMATSEKANQRRLASETLRPVTTNHWLRREPEYSLGVLRLMFQEAHPYPRTSVGNNLSDLSRYQPELIFSLVQELVEMRDENSYWIAYRTCRNPVMKYSKRALDLLDVDEYHYKDRNVYRAGLE